MMLHIHSGCMMAKNRRSACLAICIWYYGPSTLHLEVAPDSQLVSTTSQEVHDLAAQALPPLRWEAANGRDVQELAMLLYK